MFKTLFIEILKDFDNKYKFKIILLILMSTLAGAFEFIGLSLIYSFILIISSNGASIPILGNFGKMHPDSSILILGILTGFIYILKDIYMIFHIYYQNLILYDMKNIVFKKNYSDLIYQNYLQSRKIATSDKLRLLDTTISDAVCYYIGNFISLCTNVIIGLAILSYLFIKFKMYALIITVLMLSIWVLETRYFRGIAKKYSKLTSETSRAKWSFLQSTIDSQKDVIIYNKGKDFTNAAYKFQENDSKYQRIVASTQMFPSYFTEIGIMLLFILFVLLLLIKNVDGSHISASLATLAAVILRIVPTINRSQTYLHGINCIKGETKWYIEILKLIRNKKADSTDEILKINEKIKLKDIDFYYDETTHALKNINLEIKKGEFIGIVGASGSGKTTLFNVICSLFETQNGEIMIDDQVLNKHNERMWQNNISLLSQDFCLPFLSVWQNVTLEPDFNNINNIDKDKLIDALKKAGIYEEINGDIKRNTQELSCGQRHRVALARAFYFEREVIMLDEATSALDVETEEEITQTINRIKGIKTIIAIAHRIKTLKNCDRLVYMDKGEIIATDTLQNLCNNYPSFKRLVELSSF